MKPYSQDLREKIIGRLQAHQETQAQIAERFGVCLSFVGKLWRRWRETGPCAAWPHGGARQRTLASAQELITAAVARQPDATLAELCEQVAQHNALQASPSQMCRELQRLQLPRKKVALR